jgi:hypothetical protein
MRPEYHLDRGFSQVLLDLNTQREVRYLMTLTEKNPQCVFIGRVVDDQSDLSQPRYSYLAFGTPISYPAVVPEKDTRLEDVVAQFAGGASCVRLYYGGDCNLTFTDRCTDFIAGRRLVEEQRSWSRPYNNLLESGYAAPELVLATYAWP